MSTPGSRCDNRIPGSLLRRPLEALQREVWHARRPRTRKARAFPMGELLQDRVLLSNFQVTSNSDSGTGTLRAAITSLDSGGGTSNTITFDLSSGELTIALQSALPEITAQVDIPGEQRPRLSRHALARA